MGADVTIPAAAVARLFKSARDGERWWEIASMRPLLGDQAKDAKLLGHYAGPSVDAPELAFLAAGMNGATRSFVFLAPGALITFDALTAQAFQGTRWSFDPSDGLTLTKLQFNGPGFLNLISDGPAPQHEVVSDLDLIGVRLGATVVLFHNEPVSARSAVSFETTGQDTCRHLITGLAPGTWQVWRNGWLENIDGQVRSTAGALYFEARAGSYFLRRLS